MDDHDPFLDELRPRTWGRPGRRSAPVFTSIHGAYHVLSQRLRLETADAELSPSEAAVLGVLARERLLAISVVRHRTGLRASTLDSLLDRLVARDLVRRVSPRERRREVLLDLTIGGELRAHRAAAALAEIDAELRVFLAPETLAAADALFEAARALGVPGTAADV